MISNKMPELNVLTVYNQLTRAYLRLNGDD